MVQDAMTNHMRAVAFAALVFGLGTMYPTGAPAASGSGSARDLTAVCPTKQSITTFATAVRVEATTPMAAPMTFAYRLQPPAEAKTNAKVKAKAPAWQSIVDNQPLTNHVFQSSVSELVPSSTYVYQLTATNDRGRSCTSKGTFSTARRAHWRRDVLALRPVNGGPRSG
jgi:hypothetical protein